MCLLALALDQSSRFPFVFAGNRDEFFNRPASRLSWWAPEDGGHAILGGRDLQAGGTWLGLTATGRLGVLTNVRDPQNMDSTAPSRGQIVPQWLKGDTDMPTLWPRLAMQGYNGFNLLAIDFAQGDAFWVNNRKLYPERLNHGIHGLSNAILNTPWPKVQALKGALRNALAEESSVQGLTNRLFTALADPTEAPDAHLPHTGVPHEWEKRLSAAFISPEFKGYGTRCSTVIVTERTHKRVVTHVFERTFAEHTHLAVMRHVVLKNWPPRHSMSAAEVAKLDATLPPPGLRHEDAFESSEVSETHDHDIEDGHGEGHAEGKRTRARSLIKQSKVKPIV
ncbi:MAG: hypothetical protein RI907_2874 [Pseudomonadota bacterium]|jgi:uncharacterized protein with NRDE domain